MSSQRQIEANRRNGRLGGPKTPEGRQAVRFNALSHGLTAATAVLPGEDSEQFTNLLASFMEEHSPLGPTETLLVQQLAMAAWRLQPSRGMETGLFTLDGIDHQEDMDDDYSDLRPQDRHAYVFRRDCRGANSITTLARYETRHERAFFRALHSLGEREAAQPRMQICQTNPIPESDGSAPTA